MQPPMMQVIL